MRIQGPWREWLAEPVSRDHLVHVYEDHASLVDASSRWEACRTRITSAISTALIADARSASRNGRIRLCGEMVNLLWRMDQEQAAVSA